MAKRPKLGWSLSLEMRDGEAAYWLITLPVLGADHRPEPGVRRQRVRLPAVLTRREAEARARALYTAAWETAGSTERAAIPMLHGVLARYYHEVTVGPAPKARASARLDCQAFASVLAWLLDRQNGRLEHPSPPASLFPSGGDVDPRACAPIARTCDLPLADFRGPLLTEFASYLCRRMSATGVNMQLRQIRTALNWAVDQELLASAPLRKGRGFISPQTRTAGARGPIADERKRHYLLDELADLDAALPDEARRWARLSYLTGARKGELLQLTPEHVDRRRGRLRIPKGKTRSRQVLLTPAMLAELDGWTGWRFCGDWYYRQVAETALRLGIDVAQPLHAFRHTLTTALREIGVAQEDISVWLGHAIQGQKSQTGVYDHAQLAAMRRVAQATPLPWVVLEVETPQITAKNPDLAHEKGDRLSTDPLV